MNNLEQRKYDGIIFDLDGTLVDTIEDLVDSLNRVLISHGMKAATYDEGRARVGNGVRKLIQRSVKPELKGDDAFLDQALEEMKNDYYKNCIQKTRPYPGIQELLEFCNQNGIVIGVSTNKVDDASKLILKHLFPEIHFAAIMGEKIGTKRKPDPGQTLQVAREMGVSPDRLIYMGDSITDYQTAKNSGMLPVMVPYGYGKRETLEPIKDDAVWIEDPMRAVDVLKYGKDLYSVLEEEPPRIYED